MQLVYNSPHFYVVEYAAQQGFELVDKESSRGTSRSTRQGAAVS